MTYRPAQRMCRKRVNTFAELLSQGLRMFEVQAEMSMTKGEAAATMRRIRKDLGAQAV